MPIETEELTREIATVERDPYTVTYGGILRQEDDTLIARGLGKGLKLYDEVERDCHAYAVLQKRKMAVISRAWEVVAASDRRLDRKAADLVHEQLTQMNFDQTCLNLLDALLKGYAVGEIRWEVEGDLLVAREILPRDQRRFKFATDHSLRLLTPENMLDGIAVPDKKFVVHRFGSKDGNPYGLGLGRYLFWPVYFKRQDITFWLTFADKFGSPTAVGEYPPGTSPADQKKLLAAAGSIAQEAAIILPQGMALRLLEAARSVTADSYEQLARYLDEQISECVLGETLTTNIGDTGSRAASQTHQEVRLELTKADADLLSSTINNSLVRWIVELNMPGATPPTVWRVFPKDMQAQADLDTKVYGLGYRPTSQYIQQTYGNGWEPAQPLPPAGLAVPFAEQDLDVPVPDIYADRAGEPVARAMTDLIAPIRQLVDQAGSLEEIRDRLLELYPDMDAKEFNRLMQEILAASDLAGRFEVSQGA